MNGPKRNHPKETELALFSGGDMSGVWQRIRVASHLFGCASCGERVREFRAIRMTSASRVGEMPSEVDWDSLAEEMSGNIRVGIEAAECVSPGRAFVQEPARWWNARGWESFGWKQSLAYAMLGSILVCGAWWLNFPKEQKQKLAQVASSMLRGRPVLEPGVTLEGTREGIELREGGRVYMTVLYPEASMKPTSLTADLDGSMRAGYLDSSTGQMTIAKVYVE